MVTLEDYKIKPTQKIIDDLQLQIVYIPLENKLGIKYKPCIKNMDYVGIGSVIGKSPSSDMPLISTVSGTVVGLADKVIGNNKKVKCIVIENDFKERYANKIGRKYNISNYSKEEFVYLLKMDGVEGMSGNGFPTYIKWENVEELDYLIVNGCECEAYTSCDSARMYNNPEEILEVTDALMEIYGIKNAYIAVNENNSKVISKFLRHINTYPNIKIYPVMDAYPSGYERYLVNEITGLTYDKYPVEVKVMVENVQTMYAIYELLKYRKPLTSRLVTITGDGIKKPANYLLKIGSSLSEVFLKTNINKKLENPILIAGGGMMGTSISSDEFVVTADTTSIILKENKEEQVFPCIKCGKCSEVCPVNLIPSLIMDNPAKAKEYNLGKCINCGLCSYVCPSKIEVRDILKKIKEDIHG